MHVGFGVSNVREEAHMHVLSMWIRGCRFGKGSTSDSCVLIAMRWVLMIVRDMCCVAQEQHRSLCWN